MRLLLPLPALPLPQSPDLRLLPCFFLASPQGNVSVVGRKSQYSLYDNKISSFEDDGGAYDQKDAAGFIKLQALRLRTLASNRGDKWSSQLF